MSREACYWIGLALGFLSGWFITYFYCYFREKERHKKHKEALERVAKYSHWR